MKTMSRTLSYVLMIGLPMLFAINGYGLDTWQYWTVLGGVFFANILGMLRMVDDE